MIKRLRSFVYAFRGIQLVFGKEANMNIHLIMALLVIICGFIFQINITEWLICILCIGLVISLELVNSAIERIVDFISPEYQLKAGQIKDIAAGAVLIASICSAIAGLIIFIPKGLLFFTNN